MHLRHSGTWGTRALSRHSHTRALKGHLDIPALKALARLVSQALGQLSTRKTLENLGNPALEHLGTQGTLFSRPKKNICYRNLTDLEKTFSFNWRELEAIRFSLLSSIKQFENRCIFWNTDNFATQQIIKCGGNKTHINSLALNIFNLTFDHDIHLKVFWVGREYNKKADKISKTIDFDHWYTTLRLTNILEQCWGKISIHRFSSDINRKSERFSSRYLCPETESINSFSFDWANEVNLLVPTAHLIPRAIKQFLKSLTKSKAILICPYWPLFRPD